MSSPTPPTGPPATTGALMFAEEPRDGVRAYMVVNANPLTGERDRNFDLIEKPVVVENLRGQEDLYTLDNSGFQLGHQPAVHQAFANDEDIAKEYYPESVELLKEVTGASRIVIFDHTIRRRRPGQLDSDPSKRQPVAQTHIDQTPKASIARVHLHLPPSEAPALLQRRFQIINLWRPIDHPAVDWPLALCDYRSIDAKNDVFPVARISKDREGETFRVKYNPNQKWKYFYGVTPEEYILIKCFDSLQDESVALYTPHTGFEDPATPPGAPFRESIELRALVFYD
ncbi:hypothetical protein BDN72DRAFT_965247 [Pluteus cervinus]|uniref:Uncharacterized protein n=1 Tax=Pluteus cervinus TaxID=181527 RepID=A0ACD3A5Z4_9AGAR|nr:hypothetical protein BDN72DRAFT_965247 [Pluteus cervinus]